ncbi:MAG: DUF86 domain-containing protein [Nitrospirae bacterium]|nr:DUF86 domain-containing protein [Nitrospirota bacterium]
MKEELKHRLLKHLKFIEDEIKDYPKFRQLTKDEYFKDKDRRRSVERWIENIINSSIDISKVILTLEDRRLPDTYKEIVLSLSYINGLKIDSAETLAGWVWFRNVIAHEYLDIRWASIKRFVDETEAGYTNFIQAVEAYLEKKLR